MYIGMHICKNIQYDLSNYFREKNIYYCKILENTIGRRIPIYFVNDTYFSPTFYILVI